MPAETGDPPLSLLNTREEWFKFFNPLITTFFCRSLGLTFEAHTLCSQSAVSRIWMIHGGLIINRDF